jgi:phosphopantothenoylcysteine decarboxylase/phosphopantothenate--cysteine ligase
LPNLVLGVSGSIAAYRAADLARDLMRAGFTVRVCLTDAAQKFVTPILFETLTGQPCLIDTFDEPERGRMAHLDWARRADMLLLAPASANTINKIANGIAEDMLSTIALAFEGRMVIAPAMNPAMYQNPATRSSMEKLAARATAIIEPVEGDVVAGEHGQGKLADNRDIVSACIAIDAASDRLWGKKVLITSGPTYEPIDDVRFIGNRSSGKMGAALAQAALLMGADVTVIAGPSTATYPRNAVVVKVQTAQQMLDAAKRESEGVALFVGAAAVADYRVDKPEVGKIRRTADSLKLELFPNPDIIAELAQLGARTVGFAAEPSIDLRIAKEKLARKGLFAIAHNDVSDPSIGFESDRNRVTLIKADGTSAESPLASKLQVALWMLERVVEGL